MIDPVGSVIKKEGLCAPSEVQNKKASRSFFISQPLVLERRAVPTIATSSRSAEAPSPVWLSTKSDAANPMTFGQL
jgi:hypothetical protein